MNCEQQKKILENHRALVFWELDHTIRRLDNETIVIESPDCPSAGEELRADFERVGELNINPEGLSFNIIFYCRKKAFTPAELLFTIEQNRQFFPHGLEKMECFGSQLNLNVKKRLVKEWQGRNNWRIKALNSLLVNGSACAIGMNSKNTLEDSWTAKVNYRPRRGLWF